MTQANACMCHVLSCGVPQRPSACVVSVPWLGGNPGVLHLELAFSYQAGKSTLCQWLYGMYGMYAISSV